jgi:hypothetical protein
MFGSPVVTHPVCDLDLHRRIRDARRDAVARSVGRSGRNARTSFLDRVLGREPGDRPAHLDSGVFKPTGEDVGQAFRF